MVDCAMPVYIDISKTTRIFLPQPEKVRLCPCCGKPLRYYYKSSGHYFYQLSGLYYVDGQILYCYNGACALRFKPLHPLEELSLVPPKRGHGFDVLACVGQLRYGGEELKRLQIKDRLARDYPNLVISERQIQNLYELYGALVSGDLLTDSRVIDTIVANKVIVLSLDGAKPIRDNDSVWFVRDLVSGITLAAQAMTSCTTDTLVSLLLKPIKQFARVHKTPVIAVVSDKEQKIVAAVKKVFPRARHQYCQVHYVANLGEPVVKMDRELRNDVKEEFRGKVAKIEKSIRADTGEGKTLNLAESEVLLDLCEGIRSTLRFNGRQPYDPPGIRLVDDLKNLRDLVTKMNQEKRGSIFAPLPMSFRLSRSSSREANGSEGSTRTSGKWAKSYSLPTKRRRAPNACSTSYASAGKVAFFVRKAKRTSTPRQS